MCYSWTAWKLIDNSLTSLNANPIIFIKYHLPAKPYISSNHFHQQHLSTMATNVIDDISCQPTRYIANCWSQTLSTCQETMCERIHASKWPLVSPEEPKPDSSRCDETGQFFSRLKKWQGQVRDGHLPVEQDEEIWWLCHTSCTLIVTVSRQNSGVEGF